MQGPQQPPWDSCMAPMRCSCRTCSSSWRANCPPSIAARWGWFSHTCDMSATQALGRDSTKKACCIRQCPLQQGFVPLPELVEEVPSGPQEPHDVHGGHPASKSWTCQPRWSPVHVSSCLLPVQPIQRSLHALPQRRVSNSDSSRPLLVHSCRSRRCWSPRCTVRRSSRGCGGASRAVCGT